MIHKKNKIKNIKKKSLFKQDKLFILPSIIMLKEKNYGATARVKGVMFCFLYWIFQVGYVALEDEAFPKKFEYLKFLEFYKANNKKSIEEKEFNTLLSENNDLKFFFERTNIKHFYSKKIMAKIIDKKSY